METKKTYQAKPNTKIWDCDCESVYICNRSHPRKADKEQHYDIKAKLESDKFSAWVDFGHVAESKIKSLIIE